MLGSETLPPRPTWTLAVAPIEKGGSLAVMFAAASRPSRGTMLMGSREPKLMAARLLVEIMVNCGTILCVEKPTDVN